MNVITILTLLKQHRNIVFKAILGALAGLLLFSSINLYKQNKRLSESLELAQNNIEVYQNIANGAQEQNNVLKLDISKLKDYNDALVNKIDSVRKELNIKPQSVNTAATQTQTIYVKQSKGVRGQDIIKTIVKDSIYKDSLNYNDLTKVYYTIGKDTVSIALDVKNTQYLYVFKKKQYKNKKNFFKRLFTLDFKKITTFKYNIVNTNDLIKTKDVRVIESIEK